MVWRFLLAAFYIIGSHLFVMLAMIRHFLAGNIANPGSEGGGNASFSPARKIEPFGCMADAGSPFA